MMTTNRTPDSSYDSCSHRAHSHKRRSCRSLLLGLGLALVVGVWFFREPLRQRIFARGVLGNDAPTIEAVEAMLRKANHPIAAILAARNTSKIVQRQAAGLASAAARP